MQRVVGISSWLLSVFFLIIGIPTTISGLSQGPLLLSAGIVLFPPLNAFINKKIKFAPKWWMKVLAFFVLAAMLNLIVPVGATEQDSSLDVSPEPSSNYLQVSPQEDVPEPSGETSTNDTQSDIISTAEPGNTPEPIDTNEPDNTSESNNTPQPIETSDRSPSNNKGTDSQTETELSDTIEVHFIDVGQADSILILSGEQSMLVDAGNNVDEKLVVNYIKNQGVDKLDYVIGTHPHADHIGGLDAVIYEFDIGKIIMPRVQSDTRTFEDVLDAISNKGMKITSPVPGTEYTLGDASFTILAPNSEKYKETNEYSVVIKLEFGENSFLLTGDAGFPSESEMLDAGYDLKSTLLKVGHHGSYGSTSAEFLQAVNPRYAVIMVGEDNSYGHPTAEVLSLLSEKGVTTYRTDESGDIIVTSDGSTLTFNVDR